jgi:hypothetical protein
MALTTMPCAAALACDYIFRIFRNGPTTNTKKIVSHIQTYNGRIDLVQFCFSKQGGEC